MKGNFRTVGRSLFLQILVCATASLSGASPSKPFVNFSHPGSDHIGIAGFPALEVLQANNNQAMVVARESRLGSNITYSSGYITPTTQFTRPPFFSFTLYGYYKQPQWKDITSVTFKFGAQTYSAKPIYGVQGPDRDRSNDAQQSDYFESMVVTIPGEVAKGIARNNGVVVTTSPSAFYLPISASQLDRFKQVVNSVDAIAKRQAVKRNTPAKRQLPTNSKTAQSVRLGLPITEVFDEAFIHRTTVGRVAIRAFRPC